MTPVRRHQPDAPAPARKGSAGSVWHYVVGDVHGCFDSLRRLEDRIAAHAARNRVRPLVVLVGDLIDRGPASRSVVSWVRAGVAAGTHAAVLGNHDILMLECLQAFGRWPETLAWPDHLYRLTDHHARGERSARWLSPRDHADYRRMLWLSQGGYQTLVSYGCRPDRPASWDIDADDLGFLVRLPTVWCSSRVVVSHALARAVDLQAAASGDLPKRREACHRLVWSRELPEAAPDPDRIHVSGHSPMPRVRRRPGLGLVQVDTGCVYGRRLSAWCCESDQVLSVALEDPVDA